MRDTQRFLVRRVSPSGSYWKFTTKTSSIANTTPHGEINLVGSVPTARRLHPGCRTTAPLAPRQRAALFWPPVDDMIATLFAGFRRCLGG
jgi:hypothetical protein